MIADTFVYAYISDHNLFRQPKARAQLSLAHTRLLQSLNRFPIQNCVPMDEGTRPDGPRTKKSRTGGSGGWQQPTLAEPAAAPAVPVDSPLPDGCVEIDGSMLEGGATLCCLLAACSMLSSQAPAPGAVQLSANIYCQLSTAWQAPSVRPSRPDAHALGGVHSLSSGCTMSGRSRRHAGGQILRNASALAAILRRPLRVNNIRAGREKPGALRPPRLLARLAWGCAHAAALHGLLPEACPWPSGSWR